MTEQSRDPFETDALIKATTKIVAAVEALGLMRETQIAALRIAAEVIQQKHSGAIQTMTMHAMLANLFPPRK